MESIYLHGSEDVRSAANTISSAVREFGSAVGSFTFALEQHQRFLDDWLYRLEQVHEAAALRGEKK